MSNHIHPTMQPQPQRQDYQQRPPPPRPAPPSSPSEPTDTEREVAKLDKKIRNSMVIIVIFVILFIVIGIISVTVHEATYDGEIEQDRSEFGFEFSVVSATDSCPVDIDATASHKVDYFFLMTQENYDLYRNEDEYETRMTNYQQNSESSRQDTTKFNLEGKELPVDDYVIVAASPERNHRVTLDYKITRYVVQPVLIFILIIFIIIWVVIAFRIYKLHQKKQDLEFQDDQYSAGYGDYYGGYGSPPPQARSPPQYLQQQQQPPPQQTYYQQQPPPQQQPLQAPPQGRVYQPPGERSNQPRVVSSPNQMDPQHNQRPRRRRPPPPPPTSNPGSRYEPLSISCKCGGLITVESPERPIDIQCLECGRKGVVEATDDPGHSDSEEIHYF